MNDVLKSLVLILLGFSIGIYGRLPQRFVKFLSYLSTVISLSIILLKLIDKL